ncbi:hypothetical protein IGI04_039247 [Brassica rapa subsp. trilocularis]|uniref:DUF4005 domain-containing protein n=1 Tax=Brassica rapa subsp. trilocularis TaxID=1813537 RepID=A0ABQ7KM86_BRACM|nr:hypothetical protein IGI04_039247 [Brassica rapa subsp. trilocularis]
MVGSSSQVWQPKSTQSLPTKQVGGSRSTEESSAVPRTRSDSQGPMTTGASSGASHESPSVFNRLGGRQDGDKRRAPFRKKESLKQSQVVIREGGLAEVTRGFQKKPRLENSKKKEPHRFLRG